MEKYIVEVYENVVYWKNEEGQHHRLGDLLPLNMLMVVSNTGKMANFIVSVVFLP